MTKRWKITKPAPAEVIDRLVQEINVNEVIANLLWQRGVTNFNEAKLFFRPQLEQLHDPFLMKDMDKAIARIEKAISSGEKILVYGDYDVDGTTSVALVYSFLKEYAQALSPLGRVGEGWLDYYIPDRYKEGYGISTAGIDFASENNIKLIIALDCGIKAIDKVDGLHFDIADGHFRRHLLRPPRLRFLSLHHAPAEIFGRSKTQKRPQSPTRLWPHC